MNRAYSASKYGLAIAITHTACYRIYCYKCASTHARVLGSIFPNSNIFVIQLAFLDTLLYWFFSTFVLMPSFPPLKLLLMLAFPKLRFPIQIDTEHASPVVSRAYADSQIAGCCKYLDSEAEVTEVPWLDPCRWFINS
jgi:hypothetical protein